MGTQKRISSNISYGSNLLRERILINNPTAEIYGIGKLSGYKLMFDTPIGCEHSKWYGAHATIRPAESVNYVCGVIWDVHLEDMDSLDSQEAFYDPIEVQVLGDSGGYVTCRTYEMIQETTGDCLPSPHYKKVVIDGAKQNELPEEYIEYLECFPDNGVTDTPPNYRKVMDMVEIMNEEDSCEKHHRNENGIRF
uniref:gamma-glutamylcyclotransferase n=1 Tax=Arion vulgaris TaxID=1028688 RepID=A0A0B6ZSF3_9EUPU